MEDLLFILQWHRYRILDVADHHRHIESNLRAFIVHFEGDVDIPNHNPHNEQQDEQQRQNWPMIQYCWHYY